MQERKPIKRKRELQSFSREHHHSFLLCWKIRSGLKKGVSPDRIKNYTDWFYETYIVSHFRDEESLIFPILGNDHKLIKKALADHRRLVKLFEKEEDLKTCMSLLEEELDRHIRFEERILFQKIQEVASLEELMLIENVHNENQFIENLDDKFWE